MVFNYSQPQPVPNPVFVTITASDGSSPALTVSITPGAGTPSTLFPQPPVNGQSFQVGINSSTLNTLLNMGPAIYTATVTVSATGYTSATIPITLNLSTTSSIVASPNLLSFTSGGPTVQTISLTGNSGTNVSFTFSETTANGGNWLSVVASADFTPATLTVTINPLIVTVGTYTGTITITPPPPGVSFAIPVSMQVGVNALLATPTSFSFAYTQGSTIPPAQVLQLSSAAPQDTFTVETASTGNWLLVNGVTSNITGSLPATLNVTANPGTLAPGGYTGTITATDANNNTQTITASLLISGVSGVANPTTMVFLAVVGGAAPPPQTVVIQGFGSASFTATVNGAPWLSVSATSGSAPSQINVTANPTGLAAGTYDGNVIVDLDTHAQTIEVTLVVSDNPVLQATPGDLIFSYAGTSIAGGGVVASQPLTINSVGASQSFTWAPGVPAWMQVGPSGTLDAPQMLTVSITPQFLPDGLYLGQVILTPSVAGSPTAVVPVLLTVTNNPAVTASVTSMTFNGTVGGTPQSQTLGVSATTPLGFSVTPNTTTGGSWLSVSPGSGTTGSSSVPITVTANPAGLAAGTYLGTVVLTTGGGVVTQVAVTFNVAANTAPFTVSPSSLIFSYTQNGTVPAAETIQITGGQSFTASATSTGGTWLAVTPTSGTGSTTLSVSVSPATLQAGAYSGTITVTPTGGTAQTVSVTLTVTAAAIVSVSPNPLAFTYATGNPPPVAQALSVTSSGAAVQFTAGASSSGWLSVTPTSGTTPATLNASVNTASLGAGTYQGTITLSNSSGTALFTVNVSLTVTSPLPVITQLVNAASYLGGGIAPGEIVVLFGSAMGPSTGVGATVDSKGFIESGLSNVKVTFNGYAAPLLYVSATQINAIVPYEMAGSSDASVEVMFGTARSNAISLPVVSSAPGVFSANSSGTGGGAVLDQNYKLVSSSNPVSAGSVIQIFATGQGQTNPAGVDGLIEPLTLPLPYPLLAPAVTIGNVPAHITYAGAAPGLVAGALQVNAVVPPGVPSGAAQLIVSIGGNNSQNAITIAIE